MAKGLTMDPFPALTWDGWYWRGKAALPWFPAARKVDLIVRAPCSRAADPTPAKTAPPPTEAQAAAYRLLLDPQSPTATALLATLRENIPELAEADWAAAQDFLQFAELIVFVAAAGDAAYTGFVFGSAEYEHGIGVVAHRDRVTQLGFAETADEAEAEKDVRRLNRTKGRGK